MRTTLRWFVLGPLFVIAACGESAPPGPPTAPTPAPVPTISIVLTRLTPSEVSFTDTGQSVQLTVTAQFSDGTAQDVTSGLAWTVDKPDVASIERGVLTARGYGTTAFHADYQGRFAGGTVFVRIPAERLVPLTGVVRDQYGRPVPDVSIVSTGGLLLGGRTDAGGAFDLGPTYGPVRLTLEKFGYDTTEPALTVGDAPLHVQLTLPENPTPYAEHTFEVDARTTAWQTQRLQARAGRPIDVVVESAGCSARNATGVLTVRFRGGAEVVGCSARVRQIAAADEAQLEITVATPTTYRLTYRIPR